MSSVALILRGIVATGVTRLPTPAARTASRGSLSFNRPSDKNEGLEDRPVSADVSKISSVVASRSDHAVVNVRSS